MEEKTRPNIDRRDFMKGAAAAAGSAMLLPSVASGDDPGLDRRNERPDRMTYRKLGKTNFMCSRLVFGCGAALAGGKAVRLLEAAFEAGINHFDVGYDDYYKGSERHLGSFLQEHQGDVWVTSKAPARIPAQGPLTAESAKAAASYWSAELDKSLSRLKTEYVDAYYMMGISNPELVRCDEMGKAFLQAKAAGKVGHFGISTHQNAQECLEAAIETGQMSLAMIAITPAGWYDYRTKKLVDGKGTLAALKPVLHRARSAGIGLVGMKASRYIASTPYGGKYGDVTDGGPLTAFDQFYGTKLLEASLSPFQRSYMYVLENGIDVVNADMQNFKHFEENLVAAHQSHVYFA